MTTWGWGGEDRGRGVCGGGRGGGALVATDGFVSWLQRWLRVSKWLGTAGTHGALLVSW